ncbi:MAG: hypothetical protein WC583_07085, partial [Candidatus Omnitrophota bacterium]
MLLIVLPLGLLESGMEKTALLADMTEEKSESAPSGGPRPLKEPSAQSLTGILEFKIPPVNPGYRFIMVFDPFMEGFPLPPALLPAPPLTTSAGLYGKSTDDLAVALTSCNLSNASAILFCALITSCARISGLVFSCACSSLTSTGLNLLP